MGVDEGCVQDFGGETERKEPVGRPRRRGEDNIKMGIKERWGVDWIVVAQDGDRWRTVVNAAMNLRVP
jgi:hypothetical protein